MAKSDISDYSIEFRIFAAAWWQESDQSRHAMKLVRDKLRDRYDEEPPEARVIKQWASKLFETGSICDRQRSGRPNERGDAIEYVRREIAENPKTSVRRLSAELDIKRSTIHNILRDDLKLKPFKPTKVQFLTLDDHQSRVECCQSILMKYRSKKQKASLFFSDECAIYASTKATNIVMWSSENPHFWDQVLLHPPSVMIWAAMSEEHLIGPFFIDGRINADRYIQILRDEFIPELQRRGLMQTCHLQQDGAPPHTSMRTREFLNENFPNRWVGKYGPIPWPARSPDLTSPDNALWGIIKRNVLHAKPADRQELKQTVRSAFAQFDNDILKKIHDRTFRRINLCIEIGGLQVDPYD